MVLFFFLVGLEVKREFVLGELREPRQAALPIVAAVGGMVVPAAVYLASPAGSYLTGKTLEADGGITFPNLDLPIPDL